MCPFDVKMAAQASLAFMWLKLGFYITSPYLEKYEILGENNYFITRELALRRLSLVSAKMCLSTLAKDLTEPRVRVLVRLSSELPSRNTHYCSINNITGK